MTEADIRLECVRLTQPRDLANPDVPKWIERAKLIEQYVKGDGHADKAPSDSPKRQSRKPGQAEVTAPAPQ